MRRLLMVIVTLLLVIILVLIFICIGLFQRLMGNGILGRFLVGFCLIVAISRLVRSAIGMAGLFGKLGGLRIGY
jgi:uncharacterized membrane protein (DUF485 family)